MKNIIYLFLLLSTLYSCKKANKVTRATYQFSMDVNGVNCSFTNPVKLRKTIIYMTSGTAYNYILMVPVTYASGTYTGEIKLLNDSVLTTTYTVANQAGMSESEDIYQSNSFNWSFLGQYSQLYNSSYDFEFTVNSINGTQAAGTFCGDLICNAIHDTLHIANGIFSGIEID